MLISDLKDFYVILSLTKCAPFTTKSLRGIWFMPRFRINSQDSFSNVNCKMPLHLMFRWLTLEMEMFPILSFALRPWLYNWYLFTVHRSTARATRHDWKTVTIRHGGTTPAATLKTLVFGAWAQTQLENASTNVGRATLKSKEETNVESAWLRVWLASLRAIVLHVISHAS